MGQRWKTDPSLHSCEIVRDGHQKKKTLDYHEVYVDEFLNADPLRDWESFDRCKALWFWSLRKAKLNHEDVSEWGVLDCGTKDGQFPEFLQDIVEEAIGNEISMDYVKYAQEKGRSVVYGDVCNMSKEWKDESFDFVFSHHLLGLTPDYWKGLEEMYRVTKQGGYMVTCNDVPGNPRKHYSYIEGPLIFNDFTRISGAEEIFNDRWNGGFPAEWIYFVRKPEDL